MENIINYAVEQLEIYGTVADTLSRQLVLADKECDKDSDLLKNLRAERDTAIGLALQYESLLNFIATSHDDYVREYAAKKYGTGKPAKKGKAA